MMIHWSGMFKTLSYILGTNAPASAQLDVAPTRIIIEVSGV